MRPRLLAILIGLCWTWGISASQADAGFVAVSETQPSIQAASPSPQSDSPRSSRTDWLLQRLLKTMGQPPAESGMQSPSSTGSVLSIAAAGMCSGAVEFPRPATTAVPVPESDEIPRHPELDGILRPPRAV